MGFEMTAESLMQLAGIGQFLLTVYWVRNRELRERYAIGWILVATLLLACGLYPYPIMHVADSWHLAYPTAVLFMALAAVYMFAFFVSVSLTRQHRRNLRLVQEVAILELRLRTLEDQLGRQ